MKKRNFIFFGVILVLCYLFSLSAFTVREKDFVIVTQFGKPVNIIKSPGLYFKLPGFLQTLNRLDKRTTLFKTQPIQLLLRDKNPLIVTCYVCWRINDPLLFFQSLVLRDVAEQKINDMINSHLGSTLSKYEIGNIINVNSDSVKLKEIEDSIQQTANISTQSKYGIEIISVGIRRINYPRIVAQSVYERMRAEREKEAKRHRAEGEEEATKMKAEADKEVARIHSEAYKEAEIIKGRGDKEAMRIYGETFGKNPEFFEFLKTCDTLEEILKQKGTIILSTESDIFHYLDYDKVNEVYQ